jgi:GntR family transcriptional regulator, rspAB operon transcriptional repressor
MPIHATDFDRVLRCLPAIPARTKRIVSRANVAPGHHAKSCDSWSFFLDNEAFHQLVARAARLEGVWTTVQSVKTIWDRIGHLANRVPAHTLEIIVEHKDIVQALANRSPRDAAAAMRTHLHSVDHAIAGLQPLHASYFVGE